MNAAPSISWREAAVGIFAYNALLHRPENRPSHLGAGPSAPVHSHAIDLRIEFDRMVGAPIGLLSVKTVDPAPFRTWFAKAEAFLRAT